MPLNCSRSFSLTGRVSIRTVTCIVLVGPAAGMVDRFVGTWEMEESENFDEYMKALGVPYEALQNGDTEKPCLSITVDEGLICMRSQCPFKVTEILFNLNEEFDETTADAREIKTIITLEDGKLVQRQTWDGNQATIERDVQDGKLMVKYIMGDVVATRTYVKEDQSS